MRRPLVARTRSQAEGRPRLAPRLVSGLLAGLLALPAAAQAGGAPRLELAASGATDGHVTLAWSSVPGASDPVFELQTSRAPDFADPELVYAGPDRASFRSGLSAGTHHYRVRQRPAADEDGWGPWSEPVTFEFTPHALARAWTFFGIGTLLVGAILVYLFTADRRVRSEEPAG